MDNPIMLNKPWFIPNNKNAWGNKGLGRMPSAARDGLKRHTIACHNSPEPVQGCPACQTIILTIEEHEL